MGTRAEARAKKATDEVATIPLVVTQVVQQIAETGWRCHVQDNAIDVIVADEHSTLEIRIDCQDDPGRYFIYVYCPIAVPEARRAEVAEFLIAVNGPLAFAKLGMVRHNGRVFAEAGAPLGHARLLDPEVFDILVHLAVRDMDENVADVMTIAFGGATAAEVLARRQQAATPAAASA
ncbi:MAG TPA: YbjN domain-containing protein [Polyangia bacterium]|jgi:hypothetical protein